MRVGRIALVIGILLAAPTAHAGGVGVFSETTGDVKFLRGDYYFAAAPGVDVEAEDLVETADGASAQLDMADGTILRVGPASRVSLAEYRLDDSGNVLSAGIEVVSGWLRFAVAKLRNNADYRIETSTKTIGIRGTEGVIEAQDTQGGLYLEEGAVEVRAADVTAGAQAATQVRSGQYIERTHGRPFTRPGEAPPAFHNRMPPVFHERMQRRAQLLRARGVPPRQIRRIQREDARRYLERHPHMRNHLQQRMHRQLRDHPDQRERTLRGKPLHGPAPGQHRPLPRPAPGDQ